MSANVTKKKTERLAARAGDGQTWGPRSRGQSTACHFSARLYEARANRAVLHPMERTQAQENPNRAQAQS